MPSLKFINALNRVNQNVPPIWLMRQAGRYHSHYQNLKSNYTFEDLCKNPDLSAETAMGPINDFDFDVAILFSDILFPLEALGMDLSYNPGPKFEEFLNSDNIGKLFSSVDPIKFLQFQSEAIIKTLDRLPSDKSMIGFIGGPWTLLAFACGINKHQDTKHLTEFHKNCIRDYLLPLLKQNIELQLSAGAELVMIFDSSAHQIKDVDYNNYISDIFFSLIEPFSQRVGYYAKDGVNHNRLIQLAKDNPGSLAGVGVDSHVNIQLVLQDASDYFVQGNFNESFLTLPFNEFCSELDKYIITLKTLSVSERAGWVCGLGHGVLKTSQQENVRFFVQRIREAFK